MLSSNFLPFNNFFKYTLAYFLLLISSTSVIAGPDQELKICLTGSTEKAIPDYGKAFVNGAKLALRDYINQQKKSLKNKSTYDHINLNVNYYNSNPLAPVLKYTELKNQNCDAIIGFSTGNDLLAIREVSQKNPIFVLSIYGDPHPSLEKIQHIKTMQPSSKDLTKNLLEKIPIKIKNDSKILIVTAEDRSEMKSYKRDFLDELHLLKKKISLQVKEVAVSEQLHDLKKFDEFIKDKPKFDIVVILTRSLIAAEVTDKIYQFSSPIILGTKYFGSAQLPAYLNYLKNKNVTAYTSRQNNTDDQSTEYRKFVKNYRKKFNKNPMAISIDSYDATMFILRSSALKERNPLTVFNYLKKLNIEYKGRSSLKVTKGLNISTTKRFIMKIDKNGYKAIE